MRESLRNRLRDPKGIVALWCGGLTGMVVAGTAVLFAYRNMAVGILDAQRVFAAMLPFMLAAVFAWFSASRARRFNKPQIAPALWILFGIGLSVWMTQQRDFVLQDIAELVLEFTFDL